MCQATRVCPTLQEHSCHKRKPTNLAENQPFTPYTTFNKNNDIYDTIREWRDSDMVEETHGKIGEAFLQKQVISDRVCITLFSSQSALPFLQLFPRMI